MSGNSGDYYFSSNTSKGSRNNTRREDGNRDHEQDLPRLRDVLREQFEEPYDLRGMGHALPPQNSYNRQSSLRLPPIRESSSSRTRTESHEYNGRPQNPSTYHNADATSSRTQSSSRGQANAPPAYHVLAPSSAGGSLVPVSTSHTKAPGIVRGHVLTAGMHAGDDARKRFECHICGRRMERQSVYNQHMMTHTPLRPHECIYCPKSFNSKSNLNRHMSTHTSRRKDDDEPADGFNGGSSSSSKDFYSSSRRY